MKAKEATLNNERWKTHHRYCCPTAQGAEFEQSRDEGKKLAEKSSSVGNETLKPPLNAEERG